MSRSVRNTTLALLLSGGFLHSTSAQTEWQKYENNPVIVKDTTIPGIWEWAAIGQPACLFDNDTFKVWYAGGGFSGVGDTVLHGRIFYAYSTDGIHWTKHGSPTPVLDVGTPGQWDSRWLDTPAVLRDSTGYKLYYYGDSLYQQPSSAIGMATSTDGINWQRYENNPILKKSDSLLDWDGFWIESPAVLYNDETKTYEMWFTGVGYGPDCPYDQCIRIGYASSLDGKTWTKDTVNNPVLDVGEPGSWDDAWVATPAVRKIGDIYEMWYCGVSKADSVADTVRIGYATSTDGINWTKYPGNPVLSSYDSPLDSGGHWAPDVVFDGTDYVMFYEAADSSLYGGNWICMARAPLATVTEQHPIEPADRLKLAPNPFSRQIKFTLQISHPTIVSLKIYDLAGRVVKSFSLTPHSSLPTTTRIIWDGKDETGTRLPAGIYFCELAGDDHRASKKLILLR
jgi:predicted GH43/DUF377 family glycosyl hydrolase